MSAVVASLTQIYFPIDGIHEQQMLEPDNVNTPSYDFALGATNGDICNSPAGSTITDKSYWPREGHAEHTRPFLTLATRIQFCARIHGSASDMQRATNANDGGSTWRYQGGPKSQ
jgi:hypothetical protein